ncbi:hypothetical protein Tco_1414999, partial [Tanacetum coccineum]
MLSDFRGVTAIPPIQQKVGDGYNDESLSHPPGYTHETSGNVDEIKDSFSKVDDNFLAVVVTWWLKDSILMIVTVYAPQEITAEKRLWNALLLLIDETIRDVMLWSISNMSHLAKSVNS